MGTRDGRIEAGNNVGASKGTSGRYSGVAVNGRRLSREVSGGSTASSEARLRKTSSKDSATESAGDDQVIRKTWSWVHISKWSTPLSHHIQQRSLIANTGQE